MLNGLLDGWFQADVSEVAIKAVIGFVFVFLGIVILILIFALLGKIMNKVNKKPKVAAVEVKVPTQRKAEESGISPEVVAAITAAVACYMEEAAPKCEFVVRRIKKI